jgi:uncharacterized protein
MKLKFAPAKLKYSLIVLILLIGTFAVFAQTPFSINTSPLPAPTSPVNDYAGVFDSAAKQQLETKLKDFKTKTGVELAVAVVKTTGDRPIFDYSLAVARGWGIGSKDQDNPSALLFIAVDDRKYFTQVSKDLEDELPDGIVGNLQRQFLVPEFRKTNYSKGITDTIDAYIKTIESKRSGEAPPAANTDKKGGSTDASGGLYSIFCCLVVLGVIALIIWSNRSGGGRSGKDNDRWGGGGFGGGGSALPWVIGSILTSGSGSSSSSSDWGGSSGGSDWGGFGGGGDFGGGGAGGDW